MKNFFRILSVAILGGIITLSGYKIFIEKPVIISETTDTPLQTYTTHFKPAVNTSYVSATPTDFVMAAEKTVNAVVHVKNITKSTGINSWSDLLSGQGSSRQQIGTGSGVIISPDGYIVTNNHVIAGASDLEITLNNRKKYPAMLIGTDKKNDIALLKIDADMSDLPYITFADSDHVKIGEWVLAVGNPFNLNSTVTAGIISATGRDLLGNSNIDAFLQTDAAVNPGNSGGALVNTRGELVGINTAITSRTGSFIGYSFAVPSNIARKIVDDLLEFGKVQEAILGINVDNSKEAQDIEGVRISGTSEGSAKDAGLQIGDVIIMINQVKITKFSDLKGQLTAKRPGEYVSVTIDRNGKELTKKVKLSKKQIFGSNNFGIILKDLTAKEKKKYKIDYGAKIIDASANKAFNYYNVKEGYIITKINDKKISSASEAVSILDKYNPRTDYISFEMLNPDGGLERYRF